MLALRHDGHRSDRAWLLTIAGALAATVALGIAAEKNAAQPPPEAGPLPSPVTARLDLTDERLHRDFPAMALDVKGTTWVAYIEHDGTDDVLRLARKSERGIEAVAALSGRGVIHQPAITGDAAGGVWTFWGELNKRNVVSLRGRRFAGGKLADPVILAESGGSDTFADAGTDPAGRVWVVWQSLRRGQGDVFARWQDPKSGKWSREIAVSAAQGGNWEPRVAFTGSDGAWVAFDSSRGGEFNLFVAHVRPDGRAREQALTSSPEYEARVRIAAAQNGKGNGKGLWIAAERGRRQWGKPTRGHREDDGLNAGKRILLGRFDVATKTFTEVPVPGGGRPTPRPAFTVNLPAVATDADGNPWLALRYFSESRWLIAVVRYNAVDKTWSQTMEIPDSDFAQDRHSTLARDPAGKMWLCWPSDRRKSKTAGTAGVFLAQLTAALGPWREPAVKLATSDEPAPYLDSPTPPRPRDQRHTWSLGGKTYTLVFGDLHRHTDFSRCRTASDGSAIEHFRYGYDMTALDFMGTSDHTDVTKKYDPYEWWQTQRLVDVFYVPGKFESLYAYEREQKHPWGHRKCGVRPARRAHRVHQP